MSKLALGCRINERRGARGWERCLQVQPTALSQLAGLGVNSLVLLENSSAMDLLHRNRLLTLVAALSFIKNTIAPSCFKCV